MQRCRRELLRLQLYAPREALSRAISLALCDMVVGTAHVGGRLLHSGMHPGF